MRKTKRLKSKYKKTYCTTRRPMVPKKVKVKVKIKKRIKPYYQFLIMRDHFKFLKDYK